MRSAGGRMADAPAGKRVLLAAVAELGCELARHIAVEVRAVVRLPRHLLLERLELEFALDRQHLDDVGGGALATAVLDDACAGEDRHDAAARIVEREDGDHLVGPAQCGHLVGGDGERRWQAADGGLRHLKEGGQPVVQLDEDRLAEREEELVRMVELPNRLRAEGPDGVPAAHQEH